MTFAELFCDHVAAAHDRQLGLISEIGDWDWSFAMDRGEMSFTKKKFLSTRRRSTTVQILGTESNQSRTWRWAWANPASNIPPHLLQSALELRRVGEREGIAELTEPDLDLDHVDGHRLALVASGLLGKPGYYRGPFDAGAMFVLLEDEAFRPKVERPSLRIATVFPQVISTFEVPDHRRALVSYLRSYDFEVAEAAGVVSASSKQSGDTLVTTFDEPGRVANMKVQAG